MKRGDEPPPPNHQPDTQAVLSTDGQTLLVLPDLTGKADPHQWKAIVTGVDDRRDEVTGSAADGTYARAAVWHCASQLAVKTE